MNSSQLDRQLNAIQSKPGFHSTTGVSQFIRNAERLLAEEKFSSAMDQLIVAQQLDPDNQYIRAIMERVVALQSKKGTTTQHPLGVTIDKNSDPVPSDLQGVVKELTETAVRFQKDGQLESAFNALMKAYLMDPTSPHVALRRKERPPRLGASAEEDGEDGTGFPASRAACAGFPHDPAGSGEHSALTAAARAEGPGAA